MAPSEDNVAVRIKGSPPEPLSIKCPGCGSIVEYEPSDARLYRHNVDGDTYIVCPRAVCGKTISLPNPYAD